MKELEQFFKDIHRIADSIEFLVKDIVEANKKATEVLSTAVAKYEENKVPEQTQIINNQISQALIDTPQPQAVVQPAPVGIPVSNTVETYTQDQLALAMGRAIDAGLMEEIQKILSDFGVSSLVELSADKYNDLVLKLKQIGVDV